MGTVPAKCAKRFGGNVTANKIGNRGSLRDGLGTIPTSNVDNFRLDQIEIWNPAGMH